MNQHTIRRSKNTTNNIQHKTQHMSRHCLDIDWDIRHWNIFEKKKKSGSAGDRTHGGGRIPLWSPTLYHFATGLTHQMRVKIKVINSAFNHIMRVYKPAQILFFVHENPYPKKLFLFFSQNISTFFYIKNYVPNVVCCIQCRLLCCLLNVECCISMLRHMLRHWTV